MEHHGAPDAMNWDLDLALDASVLDMDHDPTSLVISTIPMAVHPSPPSSQPTRKPKAKVRKLKPTAQAPIKNKSRERMATELAFLREHVVQVEHEWRQLRKKHMEQAPPSASTLVWKNIAAQEGEKRRQSERENARLRTLVIRHLRMAKGWQRTLRKRVRGALHELLDVQIPSPSPEPAIPVMTIPTTTLAPTLPSIVELDPSATVPFDRLLHEVDLSYERLDEVLEASGLSNQFDNSRNGTEVKLRSRADGGGFELFIELRDFKCFPFPLEDTTRVGWNVTQRSYSENTDRVVEECHREQDYFAVRYRTATDYSTCAFKRFVRADSMVIAWRSVDIPFNANNSDSSDEGTKFTEETGYCLLKAYPSAHPETAPSSTCLVSCVHILPRIAGVPADSNRLMRWVNDLTRMGITSRPRDHTLAQMTPAEASFQRDVDLITDATQSMILDQRDPANSLTCVTT